MISFAQSLVDLFSSNTTGAAVIAAQTNMSNHIFNPLIFDATENAAFNAAQASWTLAEMATHYVILPALPIVANLTYKGVNYMLGCNQQPQAPVVHQRQPQAPRGFLASTWDNAKLIALKFGKHIVLPEAASYVIHQLGTKALWDKYRYYGTSFLRPFYERLLPTVYDYWDKGDLNFSLRDLIPSWQTLNPAYGVRGLFNLFRSQSVKDAEVFARSYYEWGQSISDYVIEDAKYAFRFLDGLYRSPECLRGGEAFQQCMADASNFSSEVANSSPLITTIKTTVGAAFDKWSQFLINNGMSSLVNAGRYSNEALHGIANFVESKSGIPAGVVYTAELYLLYRLGRLGASLAVEKVRANLLAGPAAVQHNNVVVQRGGHQGDQRAAQQQDVAAVLPVQPGHVQGGLGQGGQGHGGHANPVTTVNPTIAPHMQPQAQVYIVNGPGGADVRRRENAGVIVQEVPVVREQPALALQ